MRTMYVDVRVRLVITANEDIGLSEIINELEYDFSYPVATGYNGVTIEDTEITDYEIVDSK